MNDALKIGALLLALQGIDPKWALIAVAVLMAIEPGSTPIASLKHWERK